MQIVNIHQAKTQLSKLVDAVTQGEEIIIAKAGKPLIKLVPYSKVSSPKFGVLRGKIKIQDDFDAPLSDDQLAEFEGKE
jgi:prevent-host-death family protein